jgi:hypothetical protein
MRIGIQKPLQLFEKISSLVQQITDEIKKSRQYERIQRDTSSIIREQSAYCMSEEEEARLAPLEQEFFAKQTTGPLEQRLEYHPGAWQEKLLATKPEPVDLGFKRQKMFKEKIKPSVPEKIDLSFKKTDWVTSDPQQVAARKRAQQKTNMLRFLFHLGKKTYWDRLRTH